MNRTDTLQLSEVPRTGSHFLGKPWQPVRAMCGWTVVITRRICGFAAAILAAASLGWGQQVSRSLSLKAYLRPTVHLSDEFVPVDFRVADTTCQEVSLPFDISWNLDRFAKQIQVIASFSNSASALSDKQGHTIEASAVEVRIGDSSWKVFPEIRRHIVTSGLLLTTIDVADFGRQAHQHTKLQFRLCEAQILPPKGEYHGRVELHTILR